MLQIRRVKILIRTLNKEYGFDETFNEGLNFISSVNNTCGKSSIISAIYYCLGFEEIIGGKGEKVLTSAFKHSIEDGTTSLQVLESFIYVELYNGFDVLTVYRTGKMQNRDSRLVSVYYSDMDSINLPETFSEDMYVHMPNSAINKKGFHTFLEKYLGLELPLVPNVDEKERKLYLQLVFSCMFIEQKRGWSDIFSGMPVLGVKESKKRVMEFVLELDTIANERKKQNLIYAETKITNEWMKLRKDLEIQASREYAVVQNIPNAPRILKDEDLSKLHVDMNDTINSPVAVGIQLLQTEYSSLTSYKPQVVDNFDMFQNELVETEKAIEDISEKLHNSHQMLLKEELSIKNIEKNLEIIEIDLINNKDAQRLKQLGSDIAFKVGEGICPTCQQSIEDSLLPNANEIKTMTIEENIKHLTAQKDMLKFALKSHQQNKENIKKNNETLQAKLFTLRRLAKSLRNDLYSINDDLSETIVYKKLEISQKIERLHSLIEYVDNKKKEFKELSQKWEELLSEKESVPKKKLSPLDEEKIKTLKDNFISNLVDYDYRSVTNKNIIDISQETYLPTTEGFDMKFDSSASDNVRAIWAFTIALMQTSTAKAGNHPNMLIFDEPDQHSIVIKDMKKFFDSIINFSGKCQVIIGITLKDSDTRAVIDNLPDNCYKIISIENKAFTKR